MMAIPMCLTKLEAKGSDSIGEIRDVAARLGGKVAILHGANKESTSCPVKFKQQCSCMQHLRDGKAQDAGMV